MPEIWDYTTVQPFELLIVIATAMCLGSFVTAIIYREPRQISWVSNTNGNKTNAARSKCPNCNNTLRFIDLIPVFSWLGTLGKCRYCRKPIGKKYPLIEITNVALFLINYCQFGLTLEFFIISISCSFLLALFIIDWEHYILPDKLVVIVFILGLIFHVSQILTIGWNSAYFSYAIAAIFLPTFLYCVSWVVSTLKRKQSMGMGDIKLFSVVGLWLGLFYIPYFMVSCGVLGMITAIIWRYCKMVDLFPFGPAIIISLYMGILVQYGRDFSVLREYIQLF